MGSRACTPCQNWSEFSAGDLRAVSSWDPECRSSHEKQRWSGLCLCGKDNVIEDMNFTEEKWGAKVLQDLYENGIGGRN